MEDVPTGHHTTLEAKDRLAPAIRPTGSLLEGRLTASKSVLHILFHGILIGL